MTEYEIFELKYENTKLSNVLKYNQLKLVLAAFCFLHRFFYKNFFYKNHQAQNCQKVKNILRIMARLKYMINSLESPTLILHQESVLFTMECLPFTMEDLQYRKTCVRNQHTNQSKHS